MNSLTELTPAQRDTGALAALAGGSIREVAGNQLSILLGTALVNAGLVEAQPVQRDAVSITVLPTRTVTLAEASRPQVDRIVARVQAGAVLQEVSAPQADQADNYCRVRIAESPTASTDRIVGMAVTPALPPKLPKVKYRVGADMGRELGIQVAGPMGPTAPVSISYCLFRVVGGQRVQEGPPVRIPVADSRYLGRYYPVGKLAGQPGRWVIRWAIQMNFYEPLQYTEQAFDVQDAIAAVLSGDRTVRVLKPDWS